ncbi:hypothetical protein A9Q96_10050 [Rhodobacterales bacterium 52_120_T64]|nr:hypothetical protein A9Q96_10050 [Rhodobacterales bacterium 52_120_T64]
MDDTSRSERPSNDYHILPPTEKQLLYARRLALRASVILPWEAQQDRHAISAWINANAQKAPPSRFDNYASSKQVAFAERIARLKRRVIPHECFHDKSLMSKWIDGNV